MLWEPDGFYLPTMDVLPIGCSCCSTARCGHGEGTRAPERSSRNSCQYHCEVCLKCMILQNMRLSSWSLLRHATTPIRSKWPLSSTTALRWPSADAKLTTSDSQGNWPQKWLSRLRGPWFQEADRTNMRSWTSLVLSHLDVASTPSMQR